MKTNYHISEISKNYYKVRNIDLDPWWRIASIDYYCLVKNYPFRNLIESFSKPEIKVLDIGCGSAKFPSIIDQQLSENTCCKVDLLDISDHCLLHSERILKELDHFIPGRKISSSIENIHLSFPRDSCKYDLIWSIHSLATIEKNKFKASLQYLLNLLESDGKLLIFHFSQQSCYYRLYNFYVNHNASTVASNYMTSEDIKSILSTLNISCETISLQFKHIINHQDQDILKAYLHKEILDNRVHVLDLFKDEIKEYYDKSVNQYIFPQIVDFMIIQNT